MKHNQKRNDIIRLDGNSYADAMQQRIAELQAAGNNHDTTVDFGAEVAKKLEPIQQRFADRGNVRKSTGKPVPAEKLHEIIARHEKRQGAN